MRSGLREKGFSLAELMVTVAVGGVISLGVATILAGSAQEQAHVMQLIAIEAYKQELLRTLGNPSAWRNTINDATNRTHPNTMMACLTNNTDCAPSTPATQGLPFRLMNGGPAPGTLFFDSKDNFVGVTSGLTPQGAPCNTFVRSPSGLQNPPTYSGNSDCPFRFEMRWKPACSALPCRYPPVIVNARLFYNPAPGAPRLDANLERYSIIDYLVKTSPCEATTVILQPGAGPTFNVPEYNVMQVEMWSGGGGGAATGIGLDSPGQPGGPTSFGGFLVPGGAGAVGGSSSGTFVFGCLFGFCWFPFFMGGGTHVGGNATPPGPGSFPPSISMCGTSVTPPMPGYGNGISGIGGLNSMGGVANPGWTGMSPGGAGAGAPPAWNGFVGNGWGFGLIYSHGGTGGGYQSVTLYRGTTGPAPGTAVPVSVGAGGAGGIGIAILLPAPGGYFIFGFPGGDGMIRITYR